MHDRTLRHEKNFMRLSIIIPTLNEKSHISKLFDSRRAELNRCEVIIVDAPSSSDDLQSLREDFDFKYLRSPNEGRATQMNLGAENAEGDIFLFLHADVVPPENFDLLVNEKIKEDFEMGFFAYQFDPSNTWLDLNSRFTYRDGIFAGGGDQCQFFTRSLFEKRLGKFDQDFVIMEDFEIIRRVRKSGVLYSIIQEPATVSSRKYECNFYIWVNLINLLAFGAFLIGVSPSKLKRFYRRALS